MSTNNFLKLTAEEVKEPVYRVFAYNWFVDALMKRRLTIVRPKLWEDPYENYFYKFVAQKYGEKESFLIQRGENMFGQCWTLHRETDAMWRIYSPAKDGVKVKSSIIKLYKALSNQVGTLEPQDCFVGKVEYQGKKYIQKLLLSSEYLNKVHNDNTSRSIAFSLLLKRTEFSHEKEVRLLHCCLDKSRLRGDNLFDIEIDPNDIFESISIDPRMTYKEFLEKKDLIKDLGYKNPVYRSRLYSLDFGENDITSKTLKSRQSEKRK